MAIAGGDSVDQAIRTLWTIGTSGALDDRTLLSRYARHQGDVSGEAFRVLVVRHGPMVLRVCRRILGSHQDAEDAAQAVFLVLARKATSIRVEGSVAPWLHGVARRVAAKARGRTATLRRAETHTISAIASLRGRGGEGEPAPDVEEWEAIHEEVDRLPEKYRTPVVLCYLQGLTYEQAASRIGCPVGTIRVRLSRARDKLRGRLERRGFGQERLGAVGWFMRDPAEVLGPDAANVAEGLQGGGAWVDATVKAARALSMGRDAMAGTVSASVFSLYEGGIRSMLIRAWRTAALWLLAAGLTGAGAIALGAGGTGQGGQEKGVNTKSRPTAANVRQQEPVKEPAVDLDSPETLRKETERRVNAAKQRLEAQKAYYEEGRITIDRFIDASRQLMLAETTASSTKDQRLAAAKAHWDRVAEVLQREQAELVIGRGTVADVAEAILAHENAAFEYLLIRQSKAPDEIQALRQRVDSLEKQLESLQKALANPRTNAK
jgi:RNA polymerase sigma factor (sigma-70 family)